MLTDVTDYLLQHPVRRSTMYRPSQIVRRPKRYRLPQIERDPETYTLYRLSGMDQTYRWQLLPSSTIEESGQKGSGLRPRTNSQGVASESRNSVRLHACGL